MSEKKIFQSVNKIRIKKQSSSPKKDDIFIDKEFFLLITLKIKIKSFDPFEASFLNLQSCHDP